MISNPGPTPAGTQQTVTAIDRAIAGDCPCGAQPRPGSAYCGPDCEPTHIGVHTDRSGMTAMRWRPDLVTAADDTGLTRMCGPIRVGRFTRNIYHRDGTDRVHLRLDDGNRCVGADVEPVGGGEQFAVRCHRAWQRLERELTNPASVVDDGDPWADTHPAPTADSLLRGIRERQAAQARLGIPDWERRCRACGRYGEPIDGIRPAGPQRLAEQGGTAFVDLEACQACPHCRLPYPGPVLHMTVGHRPAEREWHYRLRAVVGDRKYAYQFVVLESQLTAVRSLAGYLRFEWDRMEARLLRLIATEEAALREPAPTLADLVAAGVVHFAPASAHAFDLTVSREVGYTTSDGLTQ